MTNSQKNNSLPDGTEERERLDALLLEGLDSGPATPLTPKDWERIRSEGQKLLAARKRGRK
jgi:antitoxin ParD1/3/4